MLPPLSPEVRRAINNYQVENLETRKSDIHNQGVHLRQTRTTGPIDECQVVAVYEGYQLQCRFLTPEENRPQGSKPAMLNRWKPQMAQLKHTQKSSWSGITTMATPT